MVQEDDEVCERRRAGTLPVISYNLRPSNGYLFPYCVPYYDVNEDDVVKRNYSSGFGELTFSLKSF